jgi:hypothetical protein
MGHSVPCGVRVSQDKIFIKLDRLLDLHSRAFEQNPEGGTRCLAVRDS